MHSVPSLDHIARCRRKVVEMSGYKKYLPTVKGIALHRGYSQQIWNEYARLNHIADPVNTASNLPQGYNADGEYTGQNNDRS